MLKKKHILIAAILLCAGSFSLNSAFASKITPSKSKAHFQTPLQRLTTNLAKNLRIKAKTRDSKMVELMRKLDQIFPYLNLSLRLEMENSKRHILKGKKLKNYRPKKYEKSGMKSVRISNITYILKKYNQKEAKAGNIIFEKFIDKILEISSEFRGKNSGNLSDFLQKIEQKLGFLKCLAVPVVFRNRNYTACREIPKSISLALLEPKFFEKKYTPKRRINLIGNVLRALDFLHNDCKIWHNDLQPRNFLLTKTGDLFIIDFDRAEMSKNPSKEDDFCAMLSFPIYFALCDDLNLNWKEVRFIPLFQHDIFSGIENAEDVFLGVENEGDLFSGGMEKIKEMCKQEDKSVKKQIEWINARFSDTHRQLLSIREKRENEANEHSFKCHKKRASEMQNKCRILLKKNDISSLAKHGVNVDDIKTALEQLEEAEKIKIEDPSGMSKVYEMVNSINGNVMNLLNIM